MANQGTDVEKQIEHMVAFIEQEASEKAEEIDTKAEEEFNIEKGRLVQQQRVKIMEFYNKKEKQLELTKKIQMSNSLNQSRLRVLKAREDGIKTVLDDAKQRLVHISADRERYPHMLQMLITQGLCKLVEPEVVIRCRRQDVELVQHIIQQRKCIDDYVALSGKQVKVAIDQRNYLPQECAGGVELLVGDGRFRVNNTLDARLDLVSQQTLPQLRTLLFGANANRKFDE